MVDLNELAVKTLQNAEKLDTWKMQEMRFEYSLHF